METLDVDGAFTSGSGLHPAIMSMARQRQCSLIGFMITVLKWASSLHTRHNQFEYPGEFKQRLSILSHLMIPLIDLICDLREQLRIFLQRITNDDHIRARFKRRDRLLTGVNSTADH